MGQQKTIQNRQFGSVAVDMSKIVTFPAGIYGFEDIHEYAIIDFAEYEPFQWLVALDEPDVTFPLISPILVQQDYEPEIASNLLSEIGEFDDKDLLLYAIVTLRPKGQDVTANLRGPVIINQKTRLGQQIILDSDEYSYVQSVF